MNGWIGVTYHEGFASVSWQAGVDEVNFWLGLFMKSLLTHPKTAFEAWTPGFLALRSGLPLS